ncbi:MAG: hypothetical protein U0Q15_01375 [Kineosporiaceae bacterium]
MTHDLTVRANRLWTVVLLLAVPAGVGWGLLDAASPGAGLLAAGAALVVVADGLLLAAVLRRRTLLEGTVLSDRGLRSHAVDLAAATHVALVPNRVGAALLVARDARDRVQAEVLAANAYRTGGPGPQALAALADAVGRSRAPGAASVAAALAAQGRHLSAGGELTASPIWPLTRAFAARKGVGEQSPFRGGGPLA